MNIYLVACVGGAAGSVLICLSFPLSCRLALYVYEYLLHVGAQKSAQTFLSEIRWEKNITLGEPPGFLHSWWCPARLPVFNPDPVSSRSVFWDLYCAAPDRRETCEHSSEAKAFHDYVSTNRGVPSIARDPGSGVPCPVSVGVAWRWCSTGGGGGGGLLIMRGGGRAGGGSH
ncbi:Single-stranded DNA-binding protein 2 [Acipenser ruthenus]|uniref:Single-stranded DNA-binding protein 2 n=1 Tax=Acipenser ruthenus TaxID=7906 RepID=A0A444V796_ACIRT|nr:Single-stranded DNA-binding protein 2 [Acipenser ruthenus]